MIEELKKTLEKLKDTKRFKEFQHKNPDAYLASCMFNVSGKNISEWQVDYYLPKKHKMISFILGEPIEMKGEDDIFQKEKAKIEKLILDDVKVNVDDMLDRVEKLRKEKHPGDYSNKIFAILQILEDRLIWNVTDLTTTLKIWNIKIDAKTGEVISDKMENFMSFKGS